MKGSKYARKEKRRPKPQAVWACRCGWKGQHGRRDMPDYCPACGACLSSQRERKR